MSEAPNPSPESQPLWYYADSSNEPVGPLPMNALQRLASAGVVLPDTHVIEKGGTEWKKISAIVGFIPPPPPPPPPVRSDANQHPAQTSTGTINIPSAQKRSDPIAIALLIIPIGAAVLMWAWISEMNLFQNPSSTLGFLAVGTLLATAALICFEASKLGMGANVNGERTTGPVGWFLCVLLLWVVGYPAYLYHRSRFGFTNYLVFGIASACVFTGVVFTLNSAIEDRKADVRHHLEDTQDKLRELERSFNHFGR